MHPRSTILLLLFLALLFAPGGALPPGAEGKAVQTSREKSAPADWPRFRGPGGQATSKETGLPTEWSADKNMVWKTALPGPGASSPITMGKHIFVTCYSGYGVDKDEPGEPNKLQFHVVCLDRDTGKIQWNKRIAGRPPEGGYQYRGFVSLHGYASATPVADGKSVYAFFGPTGVFAFDLKGKQLWKADVGTTTHFFGTGASPILTKDHVIVNASVESGKLVALNKADGKEAWHADNIQQSWNTPVPVAAGNGKEELVLMTRDKLLAIDPANGKERWHCAGSRPPRYICPSATSHAGIVYAINGAYGPVTAVKAGGSGDVTGTDQQLWTLKKATNVPSPVYHDGHLYWANEGGLASCVNAKDGKIVYQERFKPASGLVYASPIVADGKLYYVSREKGVFVLPARPKFEILAHNVIETDKSIFNGSPVVDGKRLLLRSDKFLYCIGKK